DFFDLKAGRQIYGGFSGVETTLEERNPDPTENGCVLEGTQTNNVIVKAGFGATSGSTALDGFTLRGATQTAIQCGDGGDPRSPALRNLHVINNSSSSGPGLQINLDSAPVVEDITFESNTSSGDGGAVYCDRANETPCFSVAPSPSTNPPTAAAGPWR
ncbi:MAG TPA: hypothetical protein VNT79_13865, partial [Phycisphaerae bacterium]|nr:hypothetical protein [Phycisphaerae bacterium]